jgi:predicted Holliday junction resolvase-like endonuclease
MANNNGNNQPQDINSKLSGLWERFALGLLSLVVTILFMVYQGQRSELKEIESKVFALQMDKVSKQDMREVEQRLVQNFDAKFTEIRQQQDASKQDILARIDLYFKKSL